MHQATINELNTWDNDIISNPDGGNILQTKAYGDFKSAHKWPAHYAIAELKDGTKVQVVFLTRKVAGLGELWYAPKGPGVKDLAQLEEFIAQVRAYVASKNVFMVKIEPDLLMTDAPKAKLEKLGLEKSKFNLQWNQATTLVDLSPSEDDIIASFKQKTRYNIRLAARKGVEVRAVDLTKDNMATMYRLLKATQGRNGFYMRSQKYLEDFWQAYTDAGMGQLFFAMHEGEVLAGLYALYLGRKGLYKDGGSKRAKTNLMAPYLMQWEVMKWLKERGVEEYDLHGMPPKDQLENPEHPLAGLVQFKSGFNPELTEYVGVYNLPIDQVKYDKWTKYGERLATTYSFKVKKELYY